MLRQEPMQLLIHNLSLQQELEEQGVFLGSKGERLWLQEQLASLEARALLGEDALHYAEDQLAFIAAQIAQWRPLSRATAHE